MRSDGLLSRTAVAGCAVWFYFWKVIWPLNLSFVYPRWSIDERNLLSYRAGRAAGDYPCLGMVATQYMGPAGGDADRLLRGAAAAGAGIREHLLHEILAGGGSLAVCGHDSALRYAGRRGRDAGRAANLESASRRHMAFLVIFAVLAGLTWRQSRMYANAETLYRATLAANPDCWLAPQQPGQALVERGCIDEALAHYERAVQLNPVTPRPITIVAWL